MFKLYKSSKLIMLVVYMIIIIMNYKHFYSYFTKHLPTNRAAISSENIRHRNFTCL